MPQIIGKSNTAYVMCAVLDPATDQQIRHMMDCPAFEGGRVVIMPDAHAGTGSVVGFTMPIGDKIIPNIVGVDIGCGIDAYHLPGVTEIDFAALHAFIQAHIPSGFGLRAQPYDLKSALPQIHRDQLDATVSKMKLDPHKVAAAIGTLGGGNHFIEINQAPNGYWVTIHTGSRNFGLQICNYHQRRAKALKLPG